MSARVTFADCVAQAVAAPKLVSEFDRLTGHHLSTIGRRTGLDRMIDDATGRDAAACNDFLAFVWDCVWIRLPPDVRAESTVPESALDP